MDRRKEREKKEGSQCTIESQPELKVCLRVVFPVYSSHPLTKKINKGVSGCEVQWGKMNRYLTWILSL